MIAQRQQSLPRKTSEPMTQGEFLLTHEDFRRIAAILQSDAGIHVTDAKATLVYSRLAKRLRTLGLTTFRELCDLVEGPEGAAERRMLLTAMTTNVTRFFREPHHFEHLKQKVLPLLLTQAKQGRRIRIWSAACSSGQEPYSIAMTIESMAPKAVTMDIKILATDIDANIIAEGKRGCYAESSMVGLPDEFRRRYFERLPGDGESTWRINDEVSNLVAFRQLNLHGNWPMKGSFDAIFCRNVVIYFDKESQSEIWSRFVPSLAPGGVLYIGHSERITGDAASKFRTDGITTYRLSNAGDT